MRAASRSGDDDGAARGRMIGYAVVTSYRRRKPSFDGGLMIDEVGAEGVAAGRYRRLTRARPARRVYIVD